MQIDESKFGKRKYHCGHHEQGQWVFVGVEHESRNCYMVVVDKQDETTFLPIIRAWIKPCTPIISDCWKAYCNLEKHGYTHWAVNHSKEFVNLEGDFKNTIDGPLETSKAMLPPFGIRKYHFLIIFGRDMWRYMHKEDLSQAFLDYVKKCINCK